MKILKYLLVKCTSEEFWPDLAHSFSHLCMCVLFFFSFFGRAVCIHSIKNLIALNNDIQSDQKKITVYQYLRVGDGFKEAESVSEAFSSQTEFLLLLMNCS